MRRERASRKRRIDWRTRLGGGLDLRIIEHPGRTMEDDELDALVDGLRSVTDRTVQGGALRYGVLSGDRARLADAILAVAYRRGTDEVVGFSAMLALDVVASGRPARVVHAGLVMVDPQLRSRGLCLAITAAPAILAFVRNGFAPLWFTNVTQIPAVAGVFATAIADVHPVPGSARAPSTAHVDIARQMVERHRSAFGVGDDAELDADAFVIRNAYTGGSDWLKKRFEDCPRHRDPRYADWCRELLDYERGDDVIQVGRMTLVHWVRVLMRLLRGVRGKRSPVRRVLDPRRVLTLQPGAGSRP